MNRLLIVLTRPMGALVRALPVLTDIKRRYPDILIDWLADARCADLLDMHWAIAEVIRLALPPERHLGPGSLSQLRKELEGSLASVSYDAVLDLEGTLESAVLSSAVQSSRRGPGFLYAEHVLAPFWYSRRAGWDKQAHAVEQYRELVAGLLDIEIQGPPVFYSVRPKARSLEVSHRVVWLIHATGQPSKSWSIKSWREVTHRLTDMGYQVRLPWASHSDQLQAEKIVSGISGAELLPAMSIPELAQAMHHTALVIGVDTGLTHLAAALHRPVVALFTSTPTWRFAPRFDRWAISVGDQGRSPAVGEVYEAAIRLLRGNKL